MRTLALAMSTLILLSLTSGCAKTSDTVGLEALRGPLVPVAEAAVRINDDALTVAVRNLLSTYRAALGE